MAPRRSWTKANNPYSSTHVATWFRGRQEASELHATVKRNVVEATWGTEHPQTPWFARNDMVGDFIPF